MKRKIVVSGIAVLCVLIGSGVFIYARQIQLSGNYMAVEHNAVSLLALTDGTDGTVTGTLYDATLNRDQVSQQQEGLHGQYSHGYLTMNVDGFLGSLFGGNISGQKSGDSITFVSGSLGTIVFKKSNMNDYEQQVAVLQTQAHKAKAEEQAQEQAQAAAQAVAAQQAQVQQNNQNAVDSAASTVNAEKNNLSNDLTNMGDDLTSMGDDLTSQGDDVTSAGDDVTSAKDDHQNGSDMSGDVKNLQNDITTQEKDFQRLKNQDLGGTIAKDESQVNTDISKIKTDYATYQNVSQEYSLTASGGSPDIQSAISNAEKTLDQYHSNENSYLQQSQQDIATVQGYASQVKSMAK